MVAVTKIHYKWSIARCGPQAGHCTRRKEYSCCINDMGFVEVFELWFLKYSAHKPTAIDQAEQNIAVDCLALGSPVFSVGCRVS